MTAKLEKKATHSLPAKGVHLPSAKVTRESNLGEVVFKYPEAAEVLTDYGLHCVGCFASSFDTINDAAKIHDMSDGEIQEMIDRVNEVIEHKE